jgi:CspA family cold shock protein
VSEQGVVREWSGDDGWGVIDCPQTPGGCWAHFSSLRAATLWTPVEGEAVELEIEFVGQDGYSFRATRVWPAGTTPADRTVRLDGASSGLRIDFD